MAITIPLGRVHIFSFVKDEADIVEDWVHYHAAIAGYGSLHIIDNDSTDGTESILRRMATAHGIQIRQATDYTRKGRLLQQWMNDVKPHPGDLLVPLDIDEFVVRFHASSSTISAGAAVREYYRRDVGEMLACAPGGRAVLKTNYIAYTQGSEFGSAPRGEGSAARVGRRGTFLDYGRMAKAFISAAALPVVRIDHGNHFSGSLDVPTVITELALVHYHERSAEQVARKALNNWKGLGYRADNVSQVFRSVRRLPAGFPGSHYQAAVLAVLSNSTSKHSWFRAGAGLGNVSLLPLARLVKASSRGRDEHEGVGAVSNVE